MKNVTLIETTTNKIKSWRLLNKDGVAIDYFDTFHSILVKKYSTNTRLSYCRGVALFIDYLEEVNNIYTSGNFSQSFLVDAIESFSEWLLYGEQSGNPIALKISEHYTAPTYSHSSVELIISSVRLFISVSEKVRITQEALNEAVSEKLFPELNTKLEISEFQRRALLQNTMLAGVVAGGPKLLSTCILPLKKSQSYFSKERAFPFGRVIEFVESFTSYRDKALYMFCAASGCRIHEALQLLIDDISIKDRSVVLIDPNSRITQSSYTTLTASEKTLLSWKGRQTDRTVLIQPFGDLFFEYLAKYIQEEYIHHNKHNFVFQHIRGVGRGKPYFLSAAPTRGEAFNNAAQKLGLSLNQGVHSLRHMYGTYLLNYFPKSDGTFGLPISVVQKIMGHSTIKATQKYARHDNDLIAVELEYANSLIYDTHKDVPLLELKRQALKSQLLEVERQCNEL